MIQALPLSVRLIVLPVLTMLLFSMTTTAKAASLETAILASRQTLFFDPLMYSELTGGKRKVFAHYFTPFPVSIDNHHATEDYYARNYLKPEGENGRFKAQGGFLRSRPLTRGSVLQDWQVEDMRREVQQAKAIGLDGFAVDILSFQGVNWERTKQMLRAAEQVGGGFAIMLMPDMNAALRTNPERFVGMITELAKFPAAMRLADGRLVVAPYMAHLRPPEWWENQLRTLRERGINVAFMPVFHNWGKHYQNYKHLAFGVSDWGARDPSVISKNFWTKMAAKAHDAGLIWMAPVVSQDVRPKSSIFFESGNSRMFRYNWEAAIEGNADWVQIVTWNDYSEHTSIAPNSATGHAFYDLTAFFTHWFKIGKPPVIKRDAIYSFYRSHGMNAKPNPTLQSQLMLPANGSALPENKVEMVAFLTEPGVLEIELAGKIYTRSTGRGLTSFTIPLREGTPIFRIKRNGAVVESMTGTPINNRIGVQNFVYQGDSSLR